MTLSTYTGQSLCTHLEQGFFAVEEVGVFVVSEVLHGPSGVASSGGPARVLEETGLAEAGLWVSAGAEDLCRFDSASAA